MNNYIYYSIMILLLVANFVIGGGIWTGVLIIASGTLAQHDARMDCQKQLGTFVKDTSEKYASYICVSEGCELTSIKSEHK